jgi:ACS family tartrate transporter-like MFS transporter
LALHGFLGLAGWQWMFLLEGLPATILGVVVLAVLPNGPREARWLTASEREALIARLHDERRRSDVAHHHRLSLALASPRVWLLSALYFCLVVGLYGISFWLPQILRSGSGWSDLRVGFMSALPYIVAAVAMVVIAAHSDRTGERRWHTATCLWIAAAGFVMSSQTTSAGPALATLTVAAIGVWGALGPFWTMPTAFLRGTAAAGGIALVNSIGNVGGFMGPYLVGFAKDATGRFEAGLLLLAGILAIGGVLAALAPQARRSKEGSDAHSASVDVDS